jgi:outer membrane protein assembly factor BamB
MFKRNDLTKAAVLGLLIVLFGVGCGNVAKPEGWASPVDSEDVLLASDHDRMVAFQGDDLNELWQFPPPDADIRATAALYGTPAISEGTAFIPSYDRNEVGSVHGVRMDDGSVIWTFEADQPILGSVTVSDEFVYVGDNDGNLYALTADAGAEAWDSPFHAEKQIWAAPALAGGTLYVTSLDGNLYALDPQTGEQRWTFETDAGIAAAPVVDGGEGLVYIASFDSTVYAIESETGEQAWAFEGSNAFWATPLLIDDTLFVADADGTVSALNAGDGTERWDSAFQAGDAIRSAVVELGGTLFVVDSSGDVYALSASEGTEQGTSLSLDSDVFADPLPRGETLIVVTADGELVQIDPEDLSIMSQRPV